MGRIFVVELEGMYYKCKFCKTYLALADDLISRASHCLRGLADLFNNVVNITAGVVEERMMRSGLHTVPDIFCCCCGQIVGLKYETAHEKSQKYKEGKFVLERIIQCGLLIVYNVGACPCHRRRIVVDEIDISP